jgi:hypothetical protein
MRAVILLLLAIAVVLAIPSRASACTPTTTGVTVCSPHAGLTTSSPVHYIAAASTSCSKGVGSIGIYSAPGNRVYLVQGSTLDTFLPLKNGTYTTTVQEWDKCGGTSKTNVTINVKGTAVLTYQHNSLRTGANLYETTLNPSNVNTSTFGKLYSFPVDSFIYGQPLYVPNMQIAGGTHNVVFVATENNSIYAFDADHKTSTPLWHTFVGTPVPCSTNQPAPGSNCNLVFLTPGVGITSTMTIDPAQGTHGAIYVEGRTNPSGAGKYFHGIHKYDLSTGKEMTGSPQTVSGTVSGTGRDNVNGVITFNNNTENNRSALLYANGVIYAAFASINDAPIYHGWIIGYDAATMSRRFVFNTTPNNSTNQNGSGEQGAIWGAALAADLSNTLYADTGNGTWDTTVTDWGNTYLKLKPSGNTLKVFDYFTPTTLAFNTNDDDLGTSTAILLPDQPGTFPHVMVGGDKLGTVYVLNRDNMGKYHSSGDQILQEIKGAVGVRLSSSADCNANADDCNYSTPAYWNGNVYFAGVNDNVKQFVIANGQLSGPRSKSPSIYSYPGTTPTISANGTTNAIVWTVEPGKAILHAYDATNLSNELFNSNQASGGRDSLGSNVKFAPPVVVAGKVFVGTQKALVVYGLLP